MTIAAMPMIYSVLQGIVIAGGVGVLYGAIKKQYRVCLGVLVTMIAVLMLSLNGVAQFIQRQGTLECAEVIKKSIQPGDRVFAFYDYFQDLPYYLRQTIGLVDVIPSEQEFGTQLEFPKDRYIRAAQLKAICEKKLQATDLESKIIILTVSDSPQDLISAIRAGEKTKERRSVRQQSLAGCGNR